MTFAGSVPKPSAQCWFALQCAATVGATVLAREKWPIRASLRPLAIYIYVFGSQSCATRLIFAGSAPLGPTKLRFCAKTLFLGAFRSAFGFAPQNATRFSAVTRPRPWPRMAPLVEFGAVLGGSASLLLPAPPLPSSSRRYAPQCFVGGIPPPRLATCLTTHPTNRVAACRSVRRSPPRPLPHLP